MDVEKLERLLAAHRAVGEQPNLRPGAAEVELAEVEEKFSLKLPSAVRTLWSWRNGSVGNPHGKALNPLFFYDGCFSGTPDVDYHIASAMEAYIDPVPEFAEEVREVGWVPIADLHGGSFLVTCGPMSFWPDVEHPVVNVKDEIAVYFDSVESMVDTCIAWFEHPDYRRVDPGPHVKEIWQARNKHRLRR